EHDQDVLADDRGEDGCRGLRRGGVALAQRIDDREAVTAGAVGDGAQQSGGDHLLGGALRVVTRLRTVDRATAAVLRHADGTLARAAGALLLERLDARTGHLAAT